LGDSEEPSLSDRAGSIGKEVIFKAVDDMEEGPVSENSSWRVDSSFEVK